MNHKLKRLSALLVTRGKQVKYNEIPLLYIYIRMAKVLRGRTVRTLLPCSVHLPKKNKCTGPHKNLYTDFLSQNRQKRQTETEPKGTVLCLSADELFKTKLMY